MGNAFTVPPVFDAYYCSFYLEGIYRVLDRRSVRFAEWPFPARNRRVLVALAPDGRRIAVDCNDSSEMDANALAWADVYGKVNLELQRVPEPSRSKVIALGPGFGVRAWSYPSALALCCRTLLGRDLRIRDVLEHVADYYRQRRYRLPESQYIPEESDPKYVFSVKS